MTTYFDTHLGIAGLSKAASLRPRAAAPVWMADATGVEANQNPLAVRWRS